MTNKTLYFFLAVIAAGTILVACSGPSGEKAASDDAKAVNPYGDNAIVYQANTSLSQIEWEGSKPGGKHNGTIRLKSGEIAIENGIITGGKLVIDMNSIICLDLEDQEYNQKLVGHLKSSDFFAVDSFPEAQFTITRVTALSAPETTATGETLTHLVTGNLKMKDTEKSISFKSNIQVSEASVSASAPQFVIDRSEWKIKYGSRKFFDDLKDKFIYDEIGLKFAFTASK